MESRILLAILICALSLAVVPAACGLTLSDPTGDDYGPDSYVYPLDPVFTAGSYDITSLTVGEAGSMVRFEIAIAGEIEDPWGSGAGFSIQSIDVYIDQDGVGGSGSTAALEGRNLEFSPASAWEYVVWCAPPFDGFETHVIDAGGTSYYSGIDVSVDQGSDVITIDVPKSILGTPDPAWRYLALMLSQSGYDQGRVRPVMEDAGQWVLGGGDNGQWDSNVIDIAAEAGIDQEALLANYNPSAGLTPILINTVDAASPVISHTPVASWEAHVPVPVEADIEDDVVVAASVHYRPSGGTYVEVAMDRIGSTAWMGTIPGSAIEVPGLEYYIEATDATNSAAQPGPASPWTVTVTEDVTPPEITSLEAFPAVFSPNDDGYRDSTAITVEAGEPCFLWLEVQDSVGTTVRTLAESVAVEADLALGWDGRNDIGAVVQDGTYRIIADCIDLGGNAGAGESTSVVVDVDQATRRLDVILLFHANQNLVPYGKAANRACYKGVLNTLRAHPTLKFVIHFSGSLLSDLLWEDPETIDILRDGAADGQFEIVGSTYIQNIIYSTRTEPDDFQFNQHQIAIHRALIEDALEVSPVSFWNPERVWTQNIVKLLTDNGYDNIQIEDHILWDSGITGSEYAVRTTTYQGKTVNVFTDDKTFEGYVNGSIDSGDTSSVMWFLRGLYAEDVDDRYAVCYHEDMEATGLWDYENDENPSIDLSNLDKLLTAMENDPAIKVTTYKDFLLEHAPYENVSPIADGGADWMGRDAWFDENAEPAAEAYRLFWDEIRDTLNAIHSEFTYHEPDTAAARALLDHAWFTLIAHQYEFAVHGYQGMVGTTQWELARTALVAARAAREALDPMPRYAVLDINDDAVSEMIFITEGDLYVFSSCGGRLLYWFDLETGAELVGNENFMRRYGEPYSDDNAYVPIAVGCEAYSWLCGNNIIPEINQYTYEARRRCFNDWVTIDGAPAGELVDMVLTYEADSAGVDFHYDLGDVEITKSVVPGLHGLDLEYVFSSSRSADLEIEIENGLSPDCLGVMLTGRGALTYWDGDDTSSVFIPDMRGVLNVASDAGLLFDFSEPPVSINGEEDVFGLEVNPTWAFSLSPAAEDTLSLGLTLSYFSGVGEPDPDKVQGRLLIFPNPSRGRVDLRLSEPLTGVLTARVYDLSGRLIRRLEGTERGSRVTISWDGLDRYGEPVAAGVYLVKITSGGITSRGKIAIIR